MDTLSRCKKCNHVLVYELPEERLDGYARCENDHYTDLKTGKVLVDITTCFVISARERALNKDNLVLLRDLAVVKGRNAVMAMKDGLVAATRDADVVDVCEHGLPMRLVSEGVIRWECRPCYDAMMKEAFSE